MRRLQAGGYANLLVRSHAELDLTDQRVVRRFFEENRPEHVFLAAAKVGGILANNTYPGEFVRENLAIQASVIHEAWRTGVRRLLFLGSSCIYPRDCPQPIREEYLLSGPLEPTNRPYAVAKIAGIEMCWSYNRQYGTRYLAAMPTNLYGPGDNYDLENSHVLPALIRKFREAKIRGDKEVVVWGTGAPRREFLYSDDMADACVFLMGLPDQAFDSLLGLQCSNPSPQSSAVSPDFHPPLINIGCGQDMTVRELAELVRATIGYEGGIHWDTGKPDGTPRKLLNVDRLLALGWQPRVSLQEGIARAYADFLKRFS